MCCAAFLPCPTAVVTVRAYGTMSPPANTPGQPVCMSRPTTTVPSLLERDAGDVLQERRVGVLPEGEDHGIGFERLVLAGWHRIMILVEPHHLDMKCRAVDLLDRAQPVDLDAFFNRLIRLEVVCRHLLARAAVNDERLRAESRGRPGGIHRGIAAAVDCDTPSNPRFLVGSFDFFQELQRVVDLAGIPRGNLLALAEVCADSEEDRIESPFGLLGHEIGDFVVQDDLDADSADAVDLAVQHFPWQAVFGDAEVHHPAGHRSRLVDDDLVSAACQVPGSRETARSSADDEHASIRWWLVGRGGPPLTECHVSQEPLDRMDADRFVNLLAVAHLLARVIADAAMDRRHRIVADDDVPGLAVVASLRLGEPGLDVFAGRAGVVARRQAVHIDRAHRTHWHHPRNSLCCEVESNWRAIRRVHRPQPDFSRSPSIPLRGFPQSCERIRCK